MSDLTVRSKSPGETRALTFDFTNELASGDTVTSATATSDAGLTLGAPTVSTPNVNVRASGGSNGSDYLVTCRANTAAGDVLEIAVTVRVITPANASYNVSSNEGKVRLIIADTQSPFTFDDVEITAFLSLWSSDIQLAAAQALRTVATSKAKMAIYYSVNGFSMDRRSVAKTLLDIADKLETRALSTPFEYESVLEDFIDSTGRDRGNYADSTPISPGQL